MDEDDGNFFIGESLWIAGVFIENASNRKNEKGRYRSAHGIEDSRAESD
jgi:hypothetical protein